MYQKIEPFGIHVHASTIGRAWMDLVEAIVGHGEVSFDEKRKRVALQNVRIKIEGNSHQDQIIDRFADKKNINDIVYLTLKGKEMFDFDVVPSFSPGAKSYYARLKEGKMVEFIVKRLTEIPESKKAVISFIHWDDYRAVLETPYDDYLPCVLTIQVRLLEKKDKYIANIIWSARSMDAYQKANGNIIAISMLADKIIKKLNGKLKKPVVKGPIDGFVTDIHIYDECFQEAQKMLKKYKEICKNDKDH